MNLRKTGKWTLMGASLALALSVGALAQTSTGENGSKTTGAKTSTSTTADMTFAKKAAQGGMAEVNLGQLAQQKGSSDTVKSFGKRMVDDHSKANEQLKSVASKDNIQLPASVDAKDQATYDRLSKMSGAAFDRAYAQDMVKDHQEDIAEFQKEANSGKNPDVRNFAQETLPTLQEHLKLAQQMASTTTAQANSKSGTAGKSPATGSY